MSDLQDRLHEAASPPARFPLEAVRRRVRRRRHMRAAASGVAALVLAVPVGMAMIPRTSPINMQVGGGPSTRAVDIDLLDAPTRLPDGYDRCGQVTHDRDVTVQRFCIGDGAELVLRFGPHDQLPELGRQVSQVRGRPVYVLTHDETRIITISDRQASDDRHYRVEAPHHVPTSALVDVITSVPAFVAATDAQAAR